MKTARQTDVLAKLLQGRRAADVRAVVALANKRGKNNLFGTKQKNPMVSYHVKQLAQLAPRLHFFSFFLCFCVFLFLLFFGGNTSVSVRSCVRLIVSVARSAGMVGSR